MNFGFNEEQELLRNTARKFFENECGSDTVRRLMETPEGISAELWKKLAEQGWLGLIYPEQYDGTGLGLVDLARRSTKNGVPATRDPLTRQKLAQMWIDTEVFKYTGARAITKLLKGELPGPEASSGKMMWVEGHQRVQEMAMELQGPYAQLMSGSRWAVENGLWQYGFLRSRANSIEGGTTEIQKNIIGERVLGLPKG